MGSEPRHIHQICTDRHVQVVRLHKDQKACANECMCACAYMCSTDASDQRVEMCAAHAHAHAEGCVPCGGLMYGVGREDYVQSRYLHAMHF